MADALTVGAGRRGPRPELLPWAEARVEICTRWRQLESLNPKLRHFQRFEWVEALASHAEATGSTVIVATANREGAPLYLCPFVVSTPRRGPLRFHRWSVLADPPFSADWAAHPAAGAREATDLVEHLLRGPADSISLNRVPDFSPLAQTFLGGHLPRRVIDSMPGLIYTLEIPADLETYKRQLSRSFRGNLRTARNRLLELPEVTYRTVESGPAMAAAMEEFLEFESTGWKGERAGDGILTSPTKRATHLRRMEALNRMGRLRLHFMATGSELVAAQLCIHDVGAVYLYKVAYNEAYPRCSPGHLMLEWLLERLRHEGVALLDCFADGAWFLPWEPGRYTVPRSTAYGDSILARLAWAKLRARRALRQAAQ